MSHQDMFIWSEIAQVCSPLVNIVCIPDFPACLSRALNPDVQVPTKADFHCEQD